MNYIRLHGVGSSRFQAMTKQQGRFSISLIRVTLGKDKGTG
jgi:hypothetical protein